MSSGATGLQESQRRLQVVLITKRVEFSASHVCRNERLTDAENEQLFGAAANPHGHGHNYVLDVTLRGDPDAVTGMVMDLKDLKEILQQQILDPFDHRFLNREVPPFDHVIPTAENIALEIWKRLAQALPPKSANGTAKLYSVRLYETQDLYVECFGE
jgi:6-pyruvoyltetrahydropterin/6-carboxytetrahydropterin synthase